MSAQADTAGGVWGVLSTQVDSVWPYAEQQIARALEYADGKITVDDVRNGLKSRDYQLWLVPGGVWVTRIIRYPQSTRLEILAAAGEWDDWLKHGHAVADWARQNGCDAVELTGRPGWGRKTGFEEIHRTFRVRI